MKLSHAAFFLGGALGIPAFFFRVGDPPMAAQVGWVAIIVVCGIVGVGRWAFQRAAGTSDH